jgi:hypothetical protein
LENILRELFFKEIYIIVSVSREEFEALNRNYGMDVGGDSTPQVVSHPNSSAEGSTVRTADTGVINSTPDGHCSACVTVLAKLDDIMSLLTALSVKVDTLEKKLSTLCEKNETPVVGSNLTG